MQGKDHMTRHNYPETIRICAAHVRASCQACLDHALWLAELERTGRTDASFAIYQTFANPVRAGVDCCWIGDKTCPEHGGAYR